MATPVRIAQIGVGAWGKNLLRNFHALPETELTWICDSRREILDSIAASYPGVSLTQDPEVLFSSKDVDAIVVATETPGHFKLAKRALESGKHVFVEKPMAQTASEALELQKLAKHNDLKLMVGHILLYHPAFEYVRDLIHTGALGEIYYIYCVRVNLGIVRSSENAFDSLAPHDISIALDFLGDNAVAVSSQGQAYLQPGNEDVVFATIYFADGKLAHLHTSWLDPHKIRKVTVVGSKKMAVIDDVEGVEKVRLYDKGVDVTADEIVGIESTPVDYATAMTVRSGEITIPKIQIKEPLRNECEHFVQTILSDSTPLSDGGNGVRVVQILEAARTSMSRGGEKVLIPLTSTRDA